MLDIKKLNLKINRLVDSLFVGNYKTAFKWRWLEFSDYRLYDENDDAKYIDFLASAREGKLLIKRFEEERELTVFFLLDLSETMNFWEDKRKIETLIETFYILAFSANKNNDKIWSIIFNDNWFEFIKPWKWIKNIHKILEIIEKNNIKKIPDFWVNKLITIFNNLPIKNSLVFLLTDKIWEIEDKNLKISSLKNDFVYINIFDFIENNLVEDGWIFRFRDKFKTFFINLRDKQKILKYRELRKNKIKDFAKKLNNLKISYLFLDNKTNIFSKLLVFFKSR
jgi:hypothetical protein